MIIILFYVNAMRTNICDHLVLKRHVESPYNKNDQFTAPFDNENFLARFAHDKYYDIDSKLKRIASVELIK